MANKVSLKRRLKEYRQNKKIQVNQKQIQKKSNKEVIKRKKHGQFPFTSDQSILLLGEGENVYCTSYDTREKAIEKYGDEISNNEEIIQGFEAKIFYGAGIKDQEMNKQVNQNLIKSIFNGSKEVLKNKGKIYITIKSGKPYEDWNICSIARSIDPPFDSRSCYPFDFDLYPGYEHRRTLGFREGLSIGDNLEIKNKSPKTWVFVRKEHIVEAKTKKEKAKKKKSN